ncbi:MAG TPA: pitrilysin family protein [Planctomycetota bacterium]|nr:pitrilysin family protein [Planctomycetota bacterium]
MKRAATTSAPARLAVELPLARHELSCGATLLVSPRKDAPVTAVQLHIRGGHALDPKGREGTAMLTGALADQGTDLHGEQEIAALLEAAGGSLSGDASGLSGTIASGHWPLLVEILCEVATRPTYPAAQVRRQRQRLLDRLLLERDDPRVQGERLFRRLVYGSHWLGRPAQASAESVRRIERRDLVAFHRASWVSQRALIAVCGDVDPERVRAMLERLLANWKAGTPLGPPREGFPPIAPRTGSFLAERAQVHVYFGHLGIRRNDPDYPALVVMDHVLGTGPGFTNRISMRLRDELGLAYSVHASIHSSAGTLPGVFNAYIGTSPEKVKTAIDGLRREIRRIQSEPVGAAELRTAKDYLVGSFALSFQRASRRASYMISAERYGLPPDNLERLPRLFAAVTPEDVRRAARAHLFPTRACIATAGPKP